MLFHGLEGSSQSHYSRSIMRDSADRGWRGMVAHFRGCSGEANRLPRAYHSGDSDEGDWILRRVHARWPQAPLYAVGISLGGNMLAKWLGERAEDAPFRHRRRVDRRAARPRRRRRGAGARLQSHLHADVPCHAQAEGAGQGGTIPGVAHVERLRASRNLYEFDNAYTAPVHGFRNTEDYWNRASGKPWLGGVRVPHLVLNAMNDPFVPADSLPNRSGVSRDVRLEQPDEGGHIGFARGSLPGRLDFLPQRLHEFFTRGD